MKLFQSLDTSILASPRQLATLSTNVVVLISGLLKSSRRKPLNWAKDHSNMVRMVSGKNLFFGCHSNFYFSMGT